MSRRPLSVRARLLLAALVPLAAAVAVLVVLSGALLNRELARQSESALLSVTEVLAHNVAAAVLFDDPDETARVLGSLRARSDIVRAAVYTADGSLYESYVGDESGEIPERGPSRTGIRYVGDRVGATALILIPDGSEIIGMVYVESDMRDLGALTRRLALGTLIVLLLALTAALGLALPLRKGILRPVQSLDAVARRISEEQDYTVRLSDVGSDELGRMGAAFNEMLDRIEEHGRILSDRESYFRSLIENSTDMIIVVDEGGTITYLSPSVTRILGHARESKVGMHFSEVVHTDDRDAVREIFGRDAPDGPRAVMMRTLHADGSTRTLEAIGVRYRDAHGVATWILNARDVTDRLHSEEERERLSEQLIQAQKMEAVGQLTGGVAHDFNNLLTVVVGNLELLGLVAELDEESEELSSGALRAAQRGAALTQRLLAFSRRQALQPEALDAAELVRGMSDLLVRTLGETIRTEFDAPDDLWLCEADPAQLESAILNLSINARDAMPDGGTLHISCRNLSSENDGTVGDDPTPDYVVVSVRDTGEGMSPDVIERVFEPFYTTKEVGKGSGLGLSMVYGFARQSGGRVELESEVGEGTTVRVLLPRAASTHLLERYETAAPGTVSGVGEHILLVEDDPDVRYTTTRLLETMGYHVEAAANGPDGLARLERMEALSLVLTDVVLPAGMSGPDFAREVHARYPGLPIVYTSGYARDHLRREGRIDSDIPLVNKPFTHETLARAIDAALGSARSSRARSRSEERGPVS